MKINIPKVVLPVPLNQYATELQGQNLFVWVNPPKNKLQEYDNLVTALQTRELETAKRTLLPDEEKAEGGRQNTEGGKQKTVLARTFEQLFHGLKVKSEMKADGVDEKLLSWYAEMWSQGAEDTRWTVGELKELEQSDPAFLSWMITATWTARTEHLQRKKKV